MTYDLGGFSPSLLCFMYLGRELWKWGSGVEVILWFLAYEKYTKDEIYFCQDFSFPFRLIGSPAQGLKPPIFRVGLSLSVDVLNWEHQFSDTYPEVCFTNLLWTLNSVMLTMKINARSMIQRFKTILKQLLLKGSSHWNLAKKMHNGQANIFTWTLVTDFNLISQFLVFQWPNFSWYLTTKLFILLS